MKSTKEIDLFIIIIESPEGGGSANEFKSSEISSSRNISELLLGRYSALKNILNTKNFPSIHCIPDANSFIL